MVQTASRQGKQLQFIIAGESRQGTPVHRAGGMISDSEPLKWWNPFDNQPVTVAQIGQLLLQHQGEKRAEHMAADRGIAGMIDRAGAQDRLGAAEQILDLQQIAVAQHRLQRRNPGVGAQHEDAIEARLLGQFAGVDLEGRAGLAIPAGCPTQIAAVGRIADQRFVATRELFAKPGDDRLPLVALAFRLGLVAAQDVRGSREFLQ